MSYSTGNPTRDAALKRAIGEVLALHEAVTLESVGEHVPNNEGPFDLDAAELAGMLDEMKVSLTKPGKGQRVPPSAPAKRPEPFGPITGHVDPALFETAEPPRHTGDVRPDSEITYEVDPALLTTAEGIERVKRGIAESEARRALDIANAKLGNAKERLYTAQVNLRDKRAALGGAAHAWQMLCDSATDGLSPEARRQVEVRNHLASTAADRAANPKRKNANAFVFSRMRFGPNRGAFDRHAAARAGYRNTDPRRGPVVKLPSDV